MRGWIARMHFKRQTMALVHRIFVTYGSKITGNYLDLQGRSGEALDDFMGEQLVNKVIRSITDGR
jgi:hypothetical protein